MSIKLDLEEYCQDNCDEFEPRVSKSESYICTFTEETKEVRTTVSCVHRNRCMALRNNLLRGLEK